MARTGQMNTYLIVLVLLDLGEWFLVGYRKIRLLIDQVHKATDRNTATDTGGRHRYVESGLLYYHDHQWERIEVRYFRVEQPW